MLVSGYKEVWVIRRGMNIAGGGITNLLLLRREDFLLVGDSHDSKH